MTASESLNTQQHGDESQPNYKLNTELLERNEIPLTPFSIIGNEEEGYFLALGRYRLSITGNSKQDVENMLWKNQWEIITNMICILANHIYETKLNETVNKNFITNEKENNQ